MVSRTYYPNGLIQTETDPLGTTTFAYDAQNREISATTSAGATTKTYYGDGLVKTVNFSNGTVRTNLFDKADRLTSVLTTLGAAVLSSVAYGYDGNGNRLIETKVNGGAPQVTTYDYDDLNRLRGVTYPAPNGRVVAYGYDQGGNRTSEVVTDPISQTVLESRTGLFDGANRLTQLTDDLDPGQTTVLVWDGNGNLRSETKAGVTTAYAYDLRDTLAEVTKGAVTEARFLGDWTERRVLKIGDPTHPSGNGTQEQVYQGSRLAVELEAGSPAARFEWTNEELISLFRSDGTRRYYSLDGLETVLALTDEQGVATDRLETDAWGVPKPGTDFGSSGNRFLFTSHRFDTETELYYAGGRYYSPTVGRFITQDNLALSPADVQTWNLFTYANDNPTFYVDPTGHESVIPYLEERQKAGEVADWKHDVFNTEPGRFADSVTKEELAYLRHLKGQAFDPGKLSEKQVTEARTLFGESDAALQQYANYATRGQLVMRHAFADPSMQAYVKELYRTTRDVNPVHFAFERGYEIGSGQEAGTGEETGRLQPALELAATYLIGKAADFVIGKALGPGSMDTRAPGVRVDSRGPRANVGASSDEAASIAPARATSKRLAYMGKTPGKASRTGREVIERMKQEGTVVEARDGSLHLVDQSGQSGRVVPLTATDMGHLEDAVRWWNREGFKYGPKADPVRRWMRDPKNYEVQPSDLNRSKGAQLPDRYRAPEAEH